jgi:hypothetical protein
MDKAFLSPNYKSKRAEASPGLSVQSVRAEGQGTG